MFGRKLLAAPEVDRRLRKSLRDLQLAERNAVLWFGEIHRRKLFRDLGYSSIYQYSAEVLGFSRPRTAQFIRLCESLEELPALKGCVASGEVPWTKAREVARVATPQRHPVGGSGPAGEPPQAGAPRAHGADPQPRQTPERRTADEAERRRKAVGAERWRRAV